MARQNINYGTNPNDGTGDSLRVAMDKINDNFIDLYGETTTQNNLVFGANSITATNINGNLSLDTNGIGTVQVSQGLEVNTGHETSDSVFYASDGSSLLTVEVQNKRVGVNKAVPAATVDVTGTAAVTGNVALNASVTVGSNANDRFTIASTVFGNLIPGTAYTLGSADSQWNQAHIETANIGTVNSTTISTDTVSATGSITGDITGQLTTSNDIRILNNGLLSRINSESLSGNRSINFPDRNGVVAVINNNRLSGPNGSPPATAIGAAGDLRGDIAADSDYIYYCTADHDGSTVIWRRAALSTW